MTSLSGAIYLFLRRREREGEREGEKHRRGRETSIGCLSHAPNGPGDPNWQPCTLRDHAQPTELHRQGCMVTFEPTRIRRARPVVGRGWAEDRGRREPGGQGLTECQGRGVSGRQRGRAAGGEAHRARSPPACVGPGNLDKSRFACEPAWSGFRSEWERKWKESRDHSSEGLRSFPAKGRGDIRWHLKGE